MKVADSTRLVLVMTAEGSAVEVLASQPSDCLHLKREHIQCETIDVFKVRFDKPLMDELNGPAELQPWSEWLQAIENILQTYQPSLLYFHLGHCHPEMKDGFSLSLQNGKKYSCLSIPENNVLLLFEL